MTQHPDDHERWQELVAAHALNALDPADQADLYAHLEHCAACQADLDGHTLTAAHLAALADDEAGSVPTWSQIRAGAMPDDAPVVSLESRRRRLAQRTLAAAAAAVVLAGVSVAGWQVAGTGGTQAQPAAVAGCRNISPCSEIALRSSDGRRRATVIVTGGVARVHPVAMSRLGAGRTYVLWQLPRGRAPVPLTEFVSANETSGASPLAVPLSQTTAFAVSNERADTHPTSPTRVLALGGVTT